MVVVINHTDSSIPILGGQNIPANGIRNLPITVLRNDDNGPLIASLEKLNKIEVRGAVKAPLNPRPKPAKKTGPEGPRSFIEEPDVSDLSKINRVTLCLASYQFVKALGRKLELDPVLLEQLTPEDCRLYVGAAFFDDPGLWS